MVSYYRQIVIYDNKINLYDFTKLFYHDMILERFQVSVLTSVADKVDPTVSKNQNAVSVLISRKFDRKLKVLKEYGER